IVVAPAHRWILGSPLSVEEADVFERTLKGLVVDVEIDDEPPVAFVCELDPSVAVERHREVTVEAPSVAWAHGQGKRPELPDHTVAYAEEIASRRLHARLAEHALIEVLLDNRR